MPAVMEGVVLIVDCDSQRSIQLCDLLSSSHYKCRILTGFRDLEKQLQRAGCLAVILDIDSVNPDQHRIRRLKDRYPGLCILCVSGKNFHPQLREMIQDDIYACLKKPVDAEELMFWLRSIEKN